MSDSAVKERSQSSIGLTQERETRSHTLTSYIAEYSRDRIVLGASILLAALILAAMVVPSFASAGAASITLDRRLEPAGLWLLDPAKAFLGTDHLGRDLVVMATRGLRTSLWVAMVVVMAGAIIGGAIGIIAGYTGGRVDDLLGRLMDLVNAFPGLLLAIAVVKVVGASATAVTVVLVLVTWVMYARVTRAQVLTLKRSQFVEAAVCIGAPVWRIMLRHLLPNIWSTLLSVAIVEIPRVMLSEASLSFLGFGIQPPEMSLGLLVSSEKDYLQINPFPVTFSGFILAMTCVGFSLVALGVRRLTDPLEKRATGW